MVRAAGVDHGGDDGQHDRPADLEGGLQYAGGQTLLVVGDPRGGLHVQRGEAEAEGRADEQQRGQDHRRVVRCRADPQEPRVTRGQAGEAGGDDPGRAEPVKHPAHPRRARRDQHAGRQEGQRGRQR